MAAIDDIFKEISPLAEAILNDNKNKTLAKEFQYDGISKKSSNKIVIMSGTKLQQPRKKFLELLFSKLKKLDSSAKFNNSGSGTITYGEKKYGQNANIVAKPNIVQVGDLLKPKQIGITDKWLTPEEIVKMVNDYMAKLRKTRPNDSLNEDSVEKISQLLKEIINRPPATRPLGPDATLEEFKFEVSLEAEDVKSEFFEVISAVRLAVLLRCEAPAIMKVFGVPRGYDLRKTFIFFPKSANYPLMDFSIGNKENLDPKSTTFKISVKSQVKSEASVTNTVKFGAVFDKGQNDLNAWYKGKEKEQRRQFVVAESALEAGPAKKGAFFPLLALSKFLNNPAIQAREQTIEAIKKVFGNGNSLSQEDNKIITNFIEYIKSIKSFSGFTSTDEKVMIMKDKRLKEVLFKAVKLFVSKRPRINRPSQTNMTMAAITYISEAIMEELSPPQDGKDPVDINFLHMFYDSVLDKKSIGYAKILRLKEGKIHLKYHTKVNFKNFRDWVGLRGKASISANKEAMGMTV